MNLPNVIGFFTVGFVAEVLPRFAPLAINSETRLLWLMVMGAVMMTIGGIYLARMAVETLPVAKVYAAVRAAIRPESAASADGETKSGSRV